MKKRIGDESGPLVFWAAAGNLWRHCKKKLIDQAAAKESPKESWAAFMQQQFRAKLVFKKTGYRAGIDIGFIRG